MTERSWDFRDIVSKKTFKCHFPMLGAQWTSIYPPLYLGSGRNSTFQQTKPKLSAGLDPTTGMWRNLFCLLQLKRVNWPFEATQSAKCINISQKTKVVSANWNCSAYLSAPHLSLLHLQPITHHLHAARATSAEQHWTLSHSLSPQKKEEKKKKKKQRLNVWYVRTLLCHCGRATGSIGPSSPMKPSQKAPMQLVTASPGPAHADRKTTSNNRRQRANKDEPAPGGPLLVKV